jgi:hypothetical protein
MTTSNRFANRLFLVVTGLITLAIGVGLVLVALPGAGFARDAATTARDAQSTVLERTPLSAVGLTGSGSYLPWLLAVSCLIVVIIAIVAASTRGRGRIDRIVESDDASGSIVVSSRFAETALVDVLSDRRDVAHVSVAAYELKGEPALKIKLRVTAGSSPTAAVEAASTAVRGLDLVLGTGRPVPVLVEVTGASPVRPGADSRVH